MRTLEGKEGKKLKNIWNNKDWEFPQISIRHQITDPGSLENKTQDKC